MFQAITSTTHKKDIPSSMSFLWWAEVDSAPVRPSPLNSGGPLFILLRKTLCFAKWLLFSNPPLSPIPKKAPLTRCFLWWAEVDSNHRSRRRQIYSLIHLATLESALVRCSFLSANCGAGDWTRTHNLLITNQLLCQLSYTGVWCLEVELNHRQTDFQSVALPTELSRHSGDPERARTVDLQRDRLAL